MIYLSCSLFIKRSNLFNQLLRNGKGFAFLTILDKDALRPVSYATQRFASSSYNQWVKIFKSYGAYIQAFEHLHPNRSDDEEYQFQIKGADYVFDMLLLLDTLKPLVDVMLQLQSLDNPVWKLKKLFPELIDRLKEAGMVSFLIKLSVLSFMNCICRQFRIIVCNFEVVNILK